eukprot:6201682-Pleurochrysis_carterae.AAC.1
MIVMHGALKRGSDLITKQVEPQAAIFRARTGDVDFHHLKKLEDTHHTRSESWLSDQSINYVLVRSSQTIQHHCKNIITDNLDGGAASLTEACQKSLVQQSFLPCWSSRKGRVEEWPTHLLDARRIYFYRYNYSKGRRPICSC